MEIMKLLNGTTEADLQNGHKIFIDWERLSPIINEIILPRPYETLKAFKVSEKGIEFIVGQKPGRKVTTKADE